MTKAELRQWVREQLGYPMVKVELTDQQIDNNIDWVRSRWIKMAVGHSTQEQYMTLMLSGGQTVYDLPANVTEVINYQDQTGDTGGINTLFSVENYMYMNGMMNGLLEGQFSLVGYHIALDFLETLQRYNPSMYQWRYDRYTNKLHIDPAPPITTVLTSASPSGAVDSPGYVLLKVSVIEGTDEDIYNEPTVKDYTLAKCKVLLGLIRRKFSSFSSVGNQGISLDGDALISEGNDEIEKLEERLREEESYTGYGIIRG